jgi:hypothetical protein
MVKEKKVSKLQRDENIPQDANLTHVHPLAAYLMPMNYEEKKDDQTTEIPELGSFDELDLTENKGEDDEFEEEEEEAEDLDETSSPSLTLNEEDLMEEKVTLIEGDKDDFDTLTRFEEDMDDFQKEIMRKGLILEDESIAEKVEDNQEISEDEFEKKLKENNLIIDEAESIDKLGDFELGSTLLLPTVDEESEEDTLAKEEGRSHLEETEVILTRVRERMNGLNKHDGDIHTRLIEDEKGYHVMKGMEKPLEHSWHFKEQATNKVPMEDEMKEVAIYQDQYTW